MTRCLACIAALLFAFMSHGEVTVSNVTVAQRVGTDLLDINYDLAASTSTNTVTVEISTNNGVAWFTPASSNMTGAVGENVLPGTKRTITWLGARELPPLLFAAVKVKVTADDPPPLYLVVDLSGGTSASSYPVTYLDNVPVGGWADEYKTTKLVLCKIPKGTFTMGSPTSELGRDSDETLHTVTLTKSFYIGVFEVTQRQWELVMGNKPSYFTNATYYATRPVEQVSYYDIRENPANSDDPAVDWPNNDVVNATSFMGKLRTKTGLSTFDLPTEAQWEYACRAGTTTALNSGRNLTSTMSCPNMSVVGRYSGNYFGGYTQNGNTDVGSAKAGSYRPNAWGIYDMHGNVWEWCLDWYGTYPGAGNDPAGVASGSGRVWRSGGWGNLAEVCRSASRHNYGGPGDRYRLKGFRVAMKLP